MIKLIVCILIGAATALVGLFIISVWLILSILED
jgi:hypothetical protein